MTFDVPPPLSEALHARLDDGRSQGIFPGGSASVAIWRNGQWTFVDAQAGALDRGGAPVTSATVYDLASLTKPFVAMTAIALHQRDAFALDARVSTLIHESANLSIGSRTWEEVLSHRSGLAAWEAFYERAPGTPGSAETEAWILRDLLPRWEAGQVGTAVYSDLGYMLAGFAMQRATRTTLDALVDDYVLRPLGLEDAVFFGATAEGSDWKGRCAPTGWSPWRRRALCGEVHDDNCAALGGVSGHAGMFGTANAVARFGAACVSAWHGRRGALQEEAIRFATAPRPGGSHRLGWDGKTEEGSAAGSHIDSEAFGHLGFTGTSSWCDPSRQAVIVLLTNRVAVPGDNEAIKAFRPEFHDAVIDALDGV